MTTLLRCPICRRVLPCTKEVKYIAAVGLDGGLSLFHEAVCVHCGTKVTVPDKTMTTKIEADIAASIDRDREKAKYLADKTMQELEQ